MIRKAILLGFLGLFISAKAMAVTRVVVPVSSCRFIPESSGTPYTSGAGDYVWLDGPLCQWSDTTWCNQAVFVCPLDFQQSDGKTFNHLTVSYYTGSGNGSALSSSRIRAWLFRNSWGASTGNPTLLAYFDSSTVGGFIQYVYKAANIVFGGAVSSAQVYWMYIAFDRGVATTPMKLSAIMVEINP